MRPTPKCVAQSGHTGPNETEDLSKHTQRQAKAKTDRLAKNDCGSYRSHCPLEHKIIKIRLIGVDIGRAPTQQYICTHIYCANEMGIWSQSYDRELQRQCCENLQ
jgi:hypothetical protein